MAPRPVCESVLAALWGHASLREAGELALILCQLPALLRFPASLYLRGRVAFYLRLPAQMGAAQAQFYLPEGRIPVLWAAVLKTEVCPQNRRAHHPFPARRAAAAGASLPV